VSKGPEPFLTRRIPDFTLKHYAWV
jgi:hypothetical protein